MTLRKQLFLAISAMFFAMLLAVLVATVSGTRGYLQEQMASHAQDAATALSHTLASSLGRNDRVLAESQVKSVFDRGYFRRIVILDLKGGVFHAQELPASTGRVPAWFARLIPMEPPPGEAFVSSGWRQLGKVGVVSQPALAYEHLWSETVELSLWLGVAYALALGLTAFLLKVVLNPLVEIERVAMSIQGRRFETIVRIPKALELARVVRAMNDLSRRVSEMLDTEFSRAEQLRREAYADPVTGLENRRGFELRLDQVLGEAQFERGWIVAATVHGLSGFNTQRGYGEGDALLLAIAQAMNERLGLGRGAFGGRIGGQSLAFVSFDEPRPVSESAAKALRLGLADLLGAAGADSDLTFSLGAAAFSPGELRSQLMARIDLATETARESGRNQLHVLPGDQAAPGSMGSMKWRSLILQAVKDRRVFAVAQPVLRLVNFALVHTEVMMRVRDVDGQTIPASVFIPMALRHKLMPRIDELAVRHALERLAKFPKRRYSVNVSGQSVGDRSFASRVEALLQEAPDEAGRLSFELSEFACVEHEPAVSAFVAQVRQLGASFGIDHFGLDPLGLQFVRRVPPDFVKLDGALVVDLIDNADVGAWVQSVIESVRPLNIEVYALFVENDAVSLRLDELGVIAGQGLLFGLAREDDA